MGEPSSEGVVSAVFMGDGLYGVDVCCDLALVNVQFYARPVAELLDYGK